MPLKNCVFKKCLIYCFLAHSGAKDFSYARSGIKAVQIFFVFIICCPFRCKNTCMCILFLLTHWKTCFKDAVFYIMVDPCNPLHNFIVFLLPSIVGFQFCLMKHQCSVLIIYRSHCKLPELALIGHWNQWL